jgi:hypothetical protein
VALLKNQKIMAAKTRLVNLDAMIPRADFALEDDKATSTCPRINKTTTH